MNIQQRKTILCWREPGRTSRSLTWHCMLMVLLFLLPGTVVFSQQNLSVSGTAKDMEGDPLLGVTVRIKGTSTGTITDADGNYTLQVTGTDEVLVFSYVGMKTQEVPVEGRTNISVVMEEEAIGLAEVVAVGYGTQRRVNVTGAVSSVESESLTKVPVASASSSITGKLAGVITKQESGEPGADATSINIRGFGNPLIIVDGVQRDFNDINVEEIESISVLKDASAAIYGARAGNGVVLVTTKRGSQSKQSFQYKNSFSFSGVANYPEFVSSGQYAELYREAEIYDGVPPDRTSYTEEEIANYYAEVPGYYNGDWWEATVRNWSPQQQHSLSMQGGNKRMRYFGLLGYINQQGMYTSGDNNLNRFNLRSNIDVNVTDDFTVALDVSGKSEYLARPIDNTNTVFTNIFNALPLYPTTLPDPDKIPYTGKGSQNPVAVTTRDISGYDDEYSTRYQTTLRLKYEFPFVKGLKAEGRLDYMGNTSYTKRWEKDFELYTYDEVNDVYALAALQNNIELNERYNRSRMITSQVSLDYKRTFNLDHNLKGLMVWEVIDSKGNNFWGMRQEFLSSAIEQFYASGIANQDLSGGAWEDGRISYVGRLNYDYKGKYLLEGSFRYDGSNRFAKENRWGFFPSVSAGWRISEENFMQTASWLNNLKLRTSYSILGYDATGQFQFLTGYVYGDDYIINDQLVRSIVSTGVPNPDITWETMTLYNTGFDIGILDHKLAAEFDVFYRLREGILTTRTVSMPSTVGADLPAENLNVMSNRGFDFTLTHQNRIGNFSYSIRAILSWSRARWEKRDEPVFIDEDEIRINKSTGRWVNEVHGYKFVGIFQDEEEIAAWPVDQDENGNTTLQPGDLKYLDYNNDSILNWRDQVVIGKSGTPEYMYAINIDMRYKSFDFFMMFQGSAEHFIEMDTRNIFASAFPKPFEYMYTDRWMPGREDPLYPRISLYEVPNNEYNSDFWLKPASYLRLKNVTLGYTLPQFLTQKASISNLRIYLAGENLLTFSKIQKYGFDPESPKDQNGKYYPQMRTLSCGITITF